jgi:hypothetical protein
MPDSVHRRAIYADRHGQHGLKRSCSWWWWIDLSTFRRISSTVQLQTDGRREGCWGTTELVVGPQNGGWAEKLCPRPPVHTARYNSRVAPNKVHICHTYSNNTYTTVLDRHCTPLLPLGQLLHQGGGVTLGMRCYAGDEKLCPRPPVYTARYYSRIAPSKVHICHTYSNNTYTIVLDRHCTPLMPSAQLLHQGSLVTLGISAAENFVRAEKLCPRPVVENQAFKLRAYDVGASNLSCHAYLICSWWCLSYIFIYLAGQKGRNIQYIQQRIILVDSWQYQDKPHVTQKLITNAGVNER